MINEEIQELKTRIISLENTIEELKTKVVQVNKEKPLINKDGIPVGLDIFSDVEGIGTVTLEVLHRKYKVKKIGDNEIIEGKKFNSLSAAAEAFSKIKRKSGWIFWRVESGKTLKEVYKG